MSVALSQSSLDVELWLSGALQSELELLGFTFHSLTDYDLQLVEVGGHVSLSDSTRDQCSFLGVCRAWRCSVPSGGDAGGLRPLPIYVR